MATQGDASIGIEVSQALCMLDSSTGIEASTTLDMRLLLPHGDEYGGRT